MYHASNSATSQRKCTGPRRRCSRLVAGAPKLRKCTATRRRCIWVGTASYEVGHPLDYYVLFFYSNIMYCSSTLTFDCSDYLLFFFSYFIFVLYFLFCYFLFLLFFVNIHILYCHCDSSFFLPRHYSFGSLLHWKHLATINYKLYITYDVWFLTFE